MFWQINKKTWTFFTKKAIAKSQSFEIQWNLYKADTIGAKKCVRFIETFSKIVWPQSKAIGSSLYCLYHRGVRFIEIPRYRYFTLFSETSKHAITLLCWSKLCCKTIRYNVYRIFLTTSKTTFLINTSVPWLNFYFAVFVVFCKSTHNQSRQLWFCNSITCTQTQFCTCSHHARPRKGEKINHLLFKVIKFTYLCHSYQETVLASQGTAIVEIATGR